MTSTEVVTSPIVVIAVELRLLRRVGRTRVLTAKGKKVLVTGGAGDLMAQLREMVFWRIASAYAGSVDLRADRNRSHTGSIGLNVAMPMVMRPQSRCVGGVARRQCL